MFSANDSPASLQTLRTEIFRAALHVKRALQAAGARGANTAALLADELAHRHLSIVLVDGGCVVDNRVTVQMTCESARRSDEESLPDRLTEQGLELGMLIDFDKNLMVDGITTMERGKQ